ncbi:uncharacterized protein LOC143292715 [Babylonia areolata]|uniref:uncharacterized protein LOC143292715 n=1 Tax=Babylonia areolata TaxID=304850 RepID=UPI003FCFD7F9
MSQSRSKSGNLSSGYSSRYSDMASSDLMSAEMSIEADGDLDTGPIDVDDEDLNAAFEAEHGSMFTVIDEVGEGNRETKQETPKGKDVEKRKFVIPKMKRPEPEDPADLSHGSGDEGKREWRKNERDVRPRSSDGASRERGHRDAGKRDGRERDTRKRDRDDSRDVRDNRSERGKLGDVKREPQNGQPHQANPATKSGTEQRQSLFESFAKEGLIADDEGMVTSNPPASKRERTVGSGMETTSLEQGLVKKGSQQLPVEDDTALEIPMGRDSMVFVREYHAWQVRLHPVSKTDMARSDFAQIWGMADSSSVAWSSHKDFGGVAEFLLKDPVSIQKFMRKILWHNFASDLLTVEITEREKSNFAQQDATGAFDVLANKVTFKFHNSRARQLIKTYYPTPQGYVTERSVYVNYINTGKAVNLLKAVFPCAAKISVARSTKETSTALVETSGTEEAVNYLVVYNQICINGYDVILSTENCDWEGAKKKYEQKQGKSDKKDAGTDKKSVGSSSTTTTTSKPPTAVKTAVFTRGGKRPADSAVSHANTSLSKRGRGATTTTNPPRQGEFVRGRGGLSRGGGSRGRGGRGGGGGGALNRNQGRPLLPDPPMGGGDGLLPLPPPPEPPLMSGSDGLLPHPDHMPGPPPPALMSLPVGHGSKGMREEELRGPREADYRTIELKEIRQELESRVQETRAQLESHLSKLDHSYRVLPPHAAKPRRPGDYMEEEDRSREAPRRTLLPMEGRPPRPEHREEWMEEPADYRHPAPTRPPPSRPAPPPPVAPPVPPPLERGYDGGAYSRGRREEDYSDVRSSRPRPYLLEAPPEQAEVHEDRETREVYDYEHARRHPHIEPEVPRRDDSRPLLSRPSLLERDRDRRDYPEERSYSSHRERYDYEDMDTRRVPSYSRYEEDSRRLAPRYKDDYDRRY